MKRLLSWAMLVFVAVTTPWAFGWATPSQLQLFIMLSSQLALVYTAVGNLWQAQQMEIDDGPDGPSGGRAGDP